MACANELQEASACVPSTKKPVSNFCRPKVSFKAYRSTKGIVNGLIQSKFLGTEGGQESVTIVVLETLIAHFRPYSFGVKDMR